MSAPRMQAVSEGWSCWGRVCRVSQKARRVRCGSCTLAEKANSQIPVQSRGTGSRTPTTLLATNAAAAADMEVLLLQHRR
jgi:hypothetical protein